MFNVTRDQAETTRDHAEAAHRTVKEHRDECRKCVTEEGKPMVPCKLGVVLERGAAKISREAEHALTAYLPAGSTVTYHGTRTEYRDRTWIVAGPDPRAPWKGYKLVGPGVSPFGASLRSLRLSSQEAQRREYADTARRAVSDCLAVLAAHDEALDAAVSVSDTGRIHVAWTSSTAVKLEARAVREHATEAGQYISAALLLLNATRAHVSDQAWEQVKRDADRARRLAARAKVRA